MPQNFVLMSKSDGVNGNQEYYYVGINLSRANTCWFIML